MEGFRLEKIKSQDLILFEHAFHHLKRKLREETPPPNPIFYKVQMLTFCSNTFAHPGPGVI